LGVPLDNDKVYQAETELGAGDRMLLYTDGITETFNSEGDEYGYERLKKFIKEHHALGANKFNDKLKYTIGYHWLVYADSAA